MKFKGIPASPGTAIGRAYLMSEESYCAIKRNIAENRVKKEISRFKKAIVSTEKDFKNARNKAVEDMGKKYASLFDAYMLILKDPLLYKDTIGIITEEKVNAGYALQSVVDHITKTFSMLDDEYMRDRVRDIQDVGNRVMRHLLGTGRVNLKEIQTRVVLVAHALHPSDAVEIKKENIVGFATDVGGRTSHIVIMAESLQIPAVVGLKRISREVSPGDLLIIDGTEGVVYINPEPEVVREYREKKRIEEKTKKKLIKLKDRPSVTLCGEKIEVEANIESAVEASTALEYGAEGIGLFRTEYIYLNRSELPSEEEMYERIKKVAVTLKPKPVIVRTVDLGADKLSDQLGIKVEKNTFMGLRGIRICLAYPSLFKIQLRAILRASAEGNIMLMYPMITGVKEVNSANHILEEVKEDLRNGGIEFDENVKVGCMVETPAAVMDITHIAQMSDFLSIGTNDLIQYTFAVDRVLESVSYLYNPADISIIKMIKQIDEAAYAAGIWAGVCGEMASDTLYTELLIGLGIRKLSMTASAIPKVKQIIINTTVQKCRDLAQRVLSLYQPQEIVDQLKESRDLIFSDTDN